MGQYFRIVNIDRSEYLDPAGFGDGAKLAQFAWGSGRTMTALALLLSSPKKDDEVVGRWAGDRVVLLGDESGFDRWKILWDQTHEPPFVDISAIVRASPAMVRG